MNFLSTNGFRVSIRRLEGLELMAQRVSLPDAQLPVADQPTPFMSLKLPGNKITYGSFTVTFKIDEYFTNYDAIRSWMSDLANESDFGNYERLQSSEYGLVSDMSVHLLDSRQNVGVTLSFVDVWPSGLGGITVDATQSDESFATVDVTFEHNGYTISRSR